jgi:hypothetical protein
MARPSGSSAPLAKGWPFASASTCTPVKLWSPVPSAPSDRSRRTVKKRACGERSSDSARKASLAAS